MSGMVGISQDEVGAGTFPDTIPLSEMERIWCISISFNGIQFIQLCTSRWLCHLPDAKGITWIHWIFIEIFIILGGSPQTLIIYLWVITLSSIPNPSHPYPLPYIISYCTLLSIIDLCLFQPWNVGAPTACVSENICAQTRMCPIIKLISRLRDKEGPSACYIHWQSR